MKYKVNLVAAVVFLLIGCSLGVADEDAKYYQLASALTKLSSAVEATVRYEQIPENATSGDIILLSTAHDKSLLTPFEGYEIKVHAADRHAIVLVCNPLADEAYLEDAGCSAELDQHHWKTDIIEACSATLDLVQLCDR